MAWPRVKCTNPSRNWGWFLFHLDVCLQCLVPSLAWPTSISDSRPSRLTSILFLGHFSSSPFSATSLQQKKFSSSVFTPLCPQPAPSICFHSDNSMSPTRILFSVIFTSCYFPLISRTPRSAILAGEQPDKWRKRFVKFIQWEPHAERALIVCVLLLRWDVFSK